ncbi:hypothetical protein ACWDU8_07215 [Streptomyces sp. NPDC003388]
MPGDETVSVIVERVVLALNAANEAAFETNEREALCDYSNQSLN